MSHLWLLFNKRREHLAAQISRNLYLKNQDFDWDNYIKYYMDHLYESLESGNHSVFGGFLAWSRSIGEHHAIPQLQKDALTENLIHTLADHFDPADQQNFINFLNQCRSKAASHITDDFSFLNRENPLGELACDYFDLLIHGDRNKAGTIVMEAHENGTAARDIYLHVFQPGLREIGRLWEQNIISVGQEHFFSAATQMIISQLYGDIFNSPRLGKKMVATAVGGELHEIGIRMVADFFEMEGWDSWYIGANCPNEDVIREIQRQEADLLAVSVTLSSHIGKARNLIDTIRALPQHKNLKILIGGRSFNNEPDLFRQLDADGNADNADEAVDTAMKIVI